MGDILVMIMSIMDIIAGILIGISLNFSTFSIIFGGIMIIKGVMGFNFSN